MNIQNQCEQSSPHSAAGILCSDKPLDAIVFIRIFHLTFLQAEKEGLLIIAAVNDVLFSTVITSTLSTNSSQPKDSCFLSNCRSCDSYNF